MLSPFHAIRDRAIAAVDLVMAEEVRLLFLDKHGKSDTSRTNVNVRGILRVGGGGARSPTGGTSWESRIAAGRAEFHIDRSEYGDRPMLRNDDKIKAVERDGNPLFEVSRIDDRHHGRLIIELSEV